MVDIDGEVTQMVERIGGIEIGKEEEEKSGVRRKRRRCGEEGEVVLIQQHKFPNYCPDKLTKCWTGI